MLTFYCPLSQVSSRDPECKAYSAAIMGPVIYHESLSKIKA